MQTNRHTCKHIHADKQTYMQMNRHTCRQIYTQTDIHADKQKYTISKKSKVESYQGRYLSTSGLHRHVHMCACIPSHVYTLVTHKFIYSPLHPPQQSRGSPEAPSAEEGIGSQSH